MDTKRETTSSSLHRKYSLIKDKFSVDVMIELTKVTMMECDNNTKCVYVREILRENGIEFDGLGSGTNRYGINMQSNIGMVAVKIALDSDGMIDNRREFLYGKEVYPDVCKVYECVPNGLIAVFEYVTPFDIGDLNRYEDQIREILERLSTVFMIGDVGIDPTNYKNWGIRIRNGKEEICMLDFAYIYKISYKLFTCECDSMTLVRYDENFVGLVCPKCGRKYKFAHIRRKVTRKKQEEEIGDIRRLGYVLKEPVEMKEDVIEFLPKQERKKQQKKKKLTELDRIKELESIEESAFENDPYNVAYRESRKEKEDHGQKEKTAKQQ